MLHARWKWASWCETQKEGCLLGQNPEERELDVPKGRRNGAFWSKMPKQGDLLDQNRKEREFDGLKEGTGLSGPKYRMNGTCWNKTQKVWSS